MQCRCRLLDEASFWSTCAVSSHFLCRNSRNATNSQPMSSPINTFEMHNHESGITLSHLVNMNSVPGASQSMSVCLHHPHHCPCISHPQPVTTQCTICLGSQPHQTRPDQGSKEGGVGDGGVGRGCSRCSPNPAAACWLCHGMPLD